MNASVIADLETLTAAISSAETVLNTYVVESGPYIGISNRLTSSIAGAKTIFDNYLSAYLQTFITNMTTTWSQVSDDGVAYGILQSIITLIGDSHISTVDDDVTSTVVGDVDTLLQHLTDSVMPLDMSTTTNFRAKLTEWRYICLNSTDGGGNIMVVNLESEITDDNNDLIPVLTLLDNIIEDTTSFDNNLSELLFDRSVGVNNALLSETLGYVAELFYNKDESPWVIFLQESSFIGSTINYDGDESYSVSPVFTVSLGWYPFHEVRPNRVVAKPHYLILDNDEVGVTGFEHMTEEDKSTILLDRLNALLLDIEEK